MSTFLATVWHLQVLVIKISHIKHRNTFKLKLSDQQRQVWPFGGWAGESVCISCAAEGPETLLSAPLCLTVQGDLHAHPVSAKCAFARSAWFVRGRGEAPPTEVPAGFRGQSWTRGTKDGGGGRKEKRVQSVSEEVEDGNEKAKTAKKRKDPLWCVYWKTLSARSLMYFFHLHLLFPLFSPHS